MITFKKIPFELGSEIVLRSPYNPSHRAKTKIIGVLEKELIMIVDPVFAISDHISAIVEDDFVAAYLHEGYLFTFKTRFDKKLLRDVICLEYPQDFQIEQLRKEVRIKVNLAAMLVISDMKNSGHVKDISENGALFELPKVLSLFKGIKFTAAFTLPNDQVIKGLQCQIMSVTYNQIHRKTSIGASFSGPADDVSKIRELVRFCMRFKV